MIYKLKINRVGIDENFPFPIKLEYDNENFYVTVLKCPEPEECKLSHYLMNGVRKGLYNKNSNYYKNNPRATDTVCGYKGNFLKNLFLCIEVKSTDSLRGGSSSSISRHPNRDGKFVVRYLSPIIQLQTIDLNTPITIPIEYSFFNRTHKVDFKSSNNDEYSGIFRATIRFNRNNKYRHGSSDREIAMLERTGIYSNIIKIELP